MKNYMWDNSMGGAIRITPAEYFLGDFLHMHGEDITMFGDGYTIVVFLEKPISLKIQS